MRAVAANRPDHLPVNSSAVREAMTNDDSDMNTFHYCRRSTSPRAYTQIVRTKYVERHMREWDATKRKMHISVFGSRNQSPSRPQAFTIFRMCVLLEMWSFVCNKQIIKMMTISPRRMRRHRCHRRRHNWIGKTNTNVIPSENCALARPSRREHTEFAHTFWSLWRARLYLRICSNGHQTTVSGSGLMCLLSARNDGRKIYSAAAPCIRLTKCNRLQTIGANRTFGSTHIARNGTAFGIILYAPP